MRFPIAITFMLLAQLMTGQEYGRRFSVGVQASGVFTTILNQQNYGQNEMQYVIPFSMGFGGILEYRISDKISAISGLTFMRLGQAYEDNFKRQKFYRDTDLNYLMVPILLKYLPWRGGVGYAGGSTAGRPQFYLVAGIQPSMLTSVNLVWEIDDQRTDFISFITEGGNPNQSIIEMNGPPDEDKDLFTDFDLILIGGIGVESEIQPNVTLYADLRGGIGALDINAEEWRLPDVNGNYFASRNAFFGIHAGILFKIF